MSVCICIPTKRKPPLDTLKNYKVPREVKTYIIADPSVYTDHRSYYSRSEYYVLPGVPGMCAQIAECYSWAYSHGHDWFLRLDDDCPPNIFRHYDESPATLDEILQECLTCAETLGVTLVGLNLKHSDMCLDYEHSDRNTYGFVNFARSTNHPELFVDTTLQKREIEYRVCAHRRHDKKLMGVVKHIYAKYSLIKNVPTVIENSVKASNEALLRIVELFPEMVTRMDLKHGGDGSVVTMKFKRIT